MTEIFFPKINLDGVKGVLTDLDNTLYNFDYCHELALKACHEFFNCGFDFAEFKRIYGKHRKIIIDNLNENPACRSRMLAFQNLAESNGMKNPYIFGLKQSEIYWKTFIRNMSVDKRALSFLKKCKAKHIPVCLVTDMLSEIQVKKIIKLKLSPYISFLVSSEEATVEKPRPGIFQLALSKLGMQPSDVIMIGDNPDKDIAGADALHIKSYLVKVEK